MGRDARCYDGEIQLSALMFLAYIEPLPLPGESWPAFLTCATALVVAGLLASVVCYWCGLPKNLLLILVACGAAIGAGVAGATLIIVQDQRGSPLEEELTEVYGLPILIYPADLWAMYDTGDEPLLRKVSEEESGVVYERNPETGEFVLNERKEGIYRNLYLLVENSSMSLTYLQDGQYLPFSEEVREEFARSSLAATSTQ